MSDPKTARERLEYFLRGYNAALETADILITAFHRGATPEQQALLISLQEAVDSFRVPPGLARSTPQTPEATHGRPD